MLQLVCRRSGVTAGGGGRVLPDAFHWEIFADLPTGKREARRKGNMEKKNCKGEGENSKWKGREKYSTLAFFFFFFFNFLKPLKFVLGLQKWKFLPGKAFHASAVVDTMFVNIYVDTKNIPTCRYNIQHIDKRTMEK